MNYDFILNLFVRLAVIAAISTIVVHSCRKDTITDCSQRGKPQYWDGTKWTCGDRQ